LDYTWCRNPDIGLPRPDAVIFLSLSSDAAALRGGYGEERYEKEEMQRRVRDVFNLLHADSRDAEDWRIIDASEGIEQVSDRIWDTVEPIIEAAKSNQLRSIL
jgi:dTMP kinase